MSLNKKGQALIEFVLILPIFLMILFIIIDFGVIFNAKNKLESNSNTMIEMLEAGDSISYITRKYQDEHPKLTITLEPDGKYTNVTISDDVSLITPGMNYILDNPYRIHVRKVIINET